jgi:hypothetical protein
LKRHLLIDRLVVVAGLVRNALPLCIQVHAGVPSAVTSTSISAVKNVLDGEVRVWPGALLKPDVGAVSEC